MSETETPSGEVIVYEAPEGDARVEVIVGEDTVWLSEAQMSALFGRDRSVVGRHIRNVFAEGELPEEGSVQIMPRTPDGGRPAAIYNLDVIISVGYRVKSKRGTQFRIWATNTLRDHLIRGYTLNQKRLAQRGVEFDQAVALLSTTLQNRQLVSSEGQAILDVVQRYARTWRMLRDYDEGVLPDPGGTHEPSATLDIKTAREAIRTLHDEMLSRGENPGLFGQERGDGLESVLLSIEQTFDGEALYPTIEARAAHLLYFVVKNHPLSDGNKRTASLLFLEYLRRNNAYLRSDGEPRFSDTALVALTLLVAESNPAHKELVIGIVLNLLAEDRG